MMNPFEYLNAINAKKNIMRDTDNDEAAEKEYVPFMVNRGLSYFQDTVTLANEMNRYSHLDKKLQFEFFINIVRPRKRVSKWSKRTVDGDLEAIKEYYGYGNRKAEQALSILNADELQCIKLKLEKGGIK